MYKVSIFILGSLLLLSTSIYAQNKQDYVWVFGSNTTSSHVGNDGFLFDFKKRPLEIESRPDSMEFTRANASICDAEGNLLMYTNGCAIANSEYEIMPNGNGINAGDYFDIWLNGDCGNGYLVLEGMVILPDPGNEYGYYLFHFPKELFIDLDPSSPNLGETKVTIENFRFTYVDMRLDNGKGDVTIKNELIFNSKFHFQHFPSIKHANGRDYWLLKHASNGNKHYKFLLDETGVSVVDSQEIGLVFEELELEAVGSSKFSPDGKVMAFFNSGGLQLYDFDRATAELSNHRMIPWEMPEGAWAVSLSFSPNSRFIYLMDQRRMFQLDTWETNLEDGLVFIDEWDGTFNPFHTTFFISALAPDCKIYVRPGSSANSWSIIHNPDEKGIACNFVQNDLQMLYTSGLGNMPNFPRFRVDDEEKCDSTITLVNGVDIFWRRDLDVYPNPSSDYVDVIIPDDIGGGTLYIITPQGQMVKSVSFGREGEVRIDVSELNSGIYNFEMLPDDNGATLIYTAKVIKL